MRKFVKSFLVALCVLLLGALGIFIALNVSSISFAFWGGAVVLAIVVAIPLAIWLAASDKTSTTVGAVIIVALLLLAALGPGLVFSLGIVWLWWDFVWGVVTLAIIGVATLLVHTYKYGS